jgi:hypothetical protein
MSLRIVLCGILLTLSALAGEDSFVRETFALPAPKQKPSLVYREKPSLQVPLMDVPQLDGRLSAKCWETAPAMKLIDATKTSEKDAHSVALVFFGKDALYIGCICPLPKEKFDGKDAQQVLNSLSSSTKHDFNVWQDESVEIFVDPGHSQSRYYQFIVNTLNTQQESEGFTLTWDGAWQSKVFVAPASGNSPLPDAIVKRQDLGLNLTELYWTCEIAIPYATFGVAAPKPGEVWGFNAVRNEKLTGLDYGWAHVRMSNHEPASFGELHCAIEQTGPQFGSRWSAPSPFAGMNQLRCTVNAKDLGGMDLRCSATGPEGAVQASARFDDSGNALIDFPVTGSGRYDVALSIHKRGAVRPYDTARFTYEFQPPVKPLELKLDQKSYYISERVMKATVTVANLDGKAEQPAEFILKSESGSELSRGTATLHNNATLVELDISALKAGSYALCVSAGGETLQKSFARIEGPFDR